MRFGIIIQARMSSARLPGKVLRDLCGRPLLCWLLEGLRQCAEAQLIVLATSTEPTDDPVALFCAQEGIPCFRGSLNDVAGRIATAAKAHNLDALVRVCGDSPLLDPSLVDAAIARYRLGGVELVTNVAQRTYPKGQSVEVLGRETLQLAEQTMDNPLDREHVTSFFYARPTKFRIYNMESGGDFGAVNFCVDTAEDLKHMAELVGRLAPGSPRPGWRALLAMQESA